MYEVQKLHFCEDTDFFCQASSSLGFPAVVPDVRAIGLDPTPKGYGFRVGGLGFRG